MGDETRLRELISQTSGYSDAEIIELRTVADKIGNLGTDWRDRAQFRANVETIAAIKRFDKASGDLVDTTNRLTKLVLAFTIITVVLAGAALWIAWLSYKLALAQGG